MKKRKQIDIKKILKMSLTMNGLQLVLILAVVGYALFYKNDDMDNLIYITLALTMLNSCMTAGGYYFTFYKKKNSLEETIENLEVLNSKLREQRHDYLNHLQVIYGLMELEEFEEAKNYMEPVYKDILKVSKALKTSHAAINALLQAKMQVAEERQIDMYLEIKTNLKAIPLEPWELCKVLANIIDNGIRALADNEGNKSIYIDMSENMTHYMIHIYNNGPQIPSYQLRDIFEEGFTTKAGEGHGMGLYITKTILEKVEGTIEAASRRDKTYFSIELPKVTIES
ncbi:MAG: sensor histidine kinase [Cellulosilyticaceae bacterium]